jgi:hypothetical protein
MAFFGRLWRKLAKQLKFLEATTNAAVDFFRIPERKKTNQRRISLDRLASKNRDVGCPKKLINPLSNVNSTTSSQKDESATTKNRSRTSQDFARPKIAR